MAEDPGSESKMRPTRVLAILVLVAVVVMAGWAAETANASLQGLRTPNLTFAVAPESNLSGSNLSLSYSNLGNQGTVAAPVVAAGVLNFSGELFFLGGYVRAAQLSTAGGDLHLSGPSYSTAEVCTPNLSFENVSYAPFVIVGSAYTFGPSTVAIYLNGSSDWPSEGQGLILPRPWGLQTANTSTVLTIVPTGAHTGKAQLEFLQWTNSTSETLEGESAPFPFDPGDPSVLTVGFNGLGNFVAQVNGLVVLRGAIPDFDPSRQQVGVWTDLRTNVLGVYLLANGETGYIAPGAVCGSLLAFPMVSGTTPSLIAPASGAYLVGPLPSPTDGATRWFVLDQFISPSQSSVDVSISGAQPVSVSAGSTASLAFGPVVE